MKLPFGLAKGDQFGDKPGWQHQIHDRVQAYTMTGSARIFALIDAVEYITIANIPGALVECGVWRGGSMMASAMTISHLGISERDLYLFDTFSGMTTPTNDDLDYKGNSAIAFFDGLRLRRRHKWCEAPRGEVESNMASTGYPMNKVLLIEGDVMRTIPEKAPAQIAMLRLDTDWYESTKHELTHLYDRVSTNGVIIIDDYGHWRGARKAVDEFIASKGLTYLMHRIDYTARMFVKTGP